MISKNLIRYKHEICVIKYAKPNQKIIFVRYNRVCVITVIVVTAMDILRPR